MSFTHEITTIITQSLVVVAVAVVVAFVLYRPPTLRQLGAISGLVVAAVVIVLAAGQVQKGVNQLSETPKRAVSAETGRDACVQELPPTLDLYTVRLPFTLWLRGQMRAGDLYSLPSDTPPPDKLCLYSVLLPALPAVAGERAQWAIAFGSIGPAMRARIASHDPAVTVFAPGFALQSYSRR